MLGLVPIGGRFGQAKLPQGFLVFVSKSYDSLAGVFAQELGWLMEEITRKGAGKIIFEEKKMRIDFPSES